MTLSQLMNEYYDFIKPPTELRMSRSTYIWWRRCLHERALARNSRLVEWDQFNDSKVVLDPNLQDGYEWH